MRKYLFLLPVLFLLYGGCVVGQKNVKVNVFAKGFEPEEPSIYINPLDNMNIIAGANIDNYYYSFDGGKTWEEGKMPGPIVRGDPVVLFDTYGNAYYSHLGTFEQPGIFLARSSDGGKTWGNSMRIYGNDIGMPFEDKEWLAFDGTNSPFSSSLYVSWTQFDKYGSPNPNDSSRILFSRSTDFGETFSAPISLSDKGGDALDGDSTVEGAVPCVGPSGEVYVAWTGPRGIEFDRSLDGGVTFGEDVFVCEQVGGWSYSIPGLFRCNGLPFTACDISGGEYNGNIYINFSDNRYGDYDVFVVKSTDGGDTWSDVIRVNDDAQGNTKDQFMSNFCVDPVSGNIYVLFYDRREHAGLRTDVYLAVSTDGGETFVNRKISDESFVPTSTVFFGDYIDINSYNDFYSAIWMRMDGAELSLMNYTNTLK